MNTRAEYAVSFQWWFGRQIENDLILFLYSFLILHMLKKKKNLPASHKARSLHFYHWEEKNVICRVNLNLSRNEGLLRTYMVVENK